jgi:hypothetical protein
MNDPAFSLKASLPLHGWAEKPLAKTAWPGLGCPGLQQLCKFLQEFCLQPIPSKLQRVLEVVPAIQESKDDVQYLLPLLCFPQRHDDAISILVAMQNTLARYKLLNFKF